MYVNALNHDEHDSEIVPKAVPKAASLGRKDGGELSHLNDR